MLRTYIVDHYEVARLGLRRALQANPSFDIVGEAASFREAMSRIGDLEVDLLVCEAMLPEGSAFRYVRPLLKNLPDLRVVFLTACEDALYAREASRCGSYGLLHKSQTQLDIVHALERVGQGTRLCESPAACHGLMSSYLSNREEEVVCCLAQGMRVKEMAHHLGVSQKTIEAHKTNIMKKLDLHSQVALIRWAITEGLILP